MAESIRLISVIIPTYNRKSSIMRAVKSVLNQKGHPYRFEVIVWDDGSTDNTVGLFKGREGLKAKDERIRFFRSPQNQGVNATRNSGIRKSKGNYILFLDSDDIMTPDCFRIIRNHEERLCEVNFFGTRDMRTKRKMYHLDRTGKYSYKDWLSGKRISGEFVSFVPRNIFDQELFDETRFCFEGFFWNKIIRRYGVFAVDVPVREYSFAEDNRISKQLLVRKNALKRYSDYNAYIDEFGAEYLRFGLTLKYCDILRIAGVYAMLAGKKTEAQMLFRECLKRDDPFASVKTFLILGLSFLGVKTFTAAYALAMSMRRD
ncbi:glycosyltransferase family 2 protein [Candidatus Woesearchaeota archaeon]|nr:glycosyltransferase family 2 protein [Candidatus Woesearchaeota archaeon]